MAKKKKTIVKLQCTDCKNYNYNTNKSHTPTVDGVKLDLKKFCNTCKKHTIHKEVKK